MLLSENDRRVLYRDSIRRVAELLRIGEPDSTPEELIEAIRDRDRYAFDVLTRFLDAWQRWYEFHRRIDAAGAIGHLTDEQNQELVTLVRNRDATRTALVRKTKQLELRRITIRVPPDEVQPGRELEIIAKIRRDLYSHGPFEIDPDSSEFSTHRDADGSASFSFVTAHEQLVGEMLRRLGYRQAAIQSDPADENEPCLNCGTLHRRPMPTVCTTCGFRDISACPVCNEEIPRTSYIKLSENLHRCPTCATRVRLRFNDPLFESSGRYSEPIVIVEQAAQ